MDISYLFDEARAYVKNGLPADHWSRSCYRDDENYPDKVWYDYRAEGKHDYDEYNDPNVIFAARFRDGLVVDHDIFSKFLDVINYSVWADTYKAMSETVYLY